MTNGSCSHRNFKALMSAQFFEALNDNLLKTLVSLLIVSTAAAGTDTAPALALASAMFVIPYLLFSSYAGFLADRFSKIKIIRIVKVIEILVVSLAAFFLSQKNIQALYFCLFLMGCHSTLFSPSKYGVLPELLDDDQLSRGNGFMQFWTFAAILIGTASAGALMSVASGNLLIPGLALIAFASLGLVSGLLISKTPAARPQAKFKLNPFAEVGGALKEIYRDRQMYLTLLALSYFWLMGALFQLNIYLFANQHLHTSDLATAALVTALALGIGCGSIYAGKVSEGKVEMGLVPLGALGISFFCMLMVLAQHSYNLSLILFFLLGLSAGFFVVPLSAYMQHYSPAESRGRYLAANNFANFVGILLASALLSLLKTVLGLTPAQIFLVLGCSTIGVTLFIFRTLPEAFVRCVNWILTHTVYRVRVLGVENIPAQGGALLVCNHASFVDPSLILGAIERPVRFLMFRPIYEAPFVHWFARTMQAIPVSPFDKSQQIANSLSTAQEKIKQGELVGIFAEGSITRTGTLLPFRKGFERIMNGVDAPIIPVHIDRIWGSIFSFKDGRFIFKLPRRLPYPITISFGQAMPGSSKTYQVRQAVQELSGVAFKYRSDDDETLHTQFLRVARKQPFRACITDSSGRKLNYLALASQSLLLATKLQAKLGEQRMLGIMLPPSLAGVLANLAAMLAGYIPVNLNYSASPEALHSACQQCQLRHVISSQAFLEKLDIKLPLELLKIEELIGKCGKGRALVAAIQTWLLPEFLLKRLYPIAPAKMNDLATVIFSSGSTATPKGVMLSHSNISSNIQSLYDIFQLEKNDTVLGVLPFFHSFGFTGTLWFPLLSGLKSVYHYSPVDAGKIGELAEQHRVSIMMSTPTFLMSYVRKCEPKQFSNFKYVVVGAEKLKASVATAFEEKFGIEPLEGYGCTELSPVAILSLPDFEVGKIKQVGKKEGRVGHPIPGVSVKVLNPDNFQILPPGTDGLLMVKGPNVMLGYLGDPQRTANAIQDGWYNTGDIANIDQDGFVAITDRLSRFSKIGGEMVPHIKIEEEIHRVTKAVGQTCVVTSVADDKKGERLVVLHLQTLDTNDVISKLSESGMPNLWIPKRDSFFAIEELPMLGSGKLDLKAIKSLAIKLTSV